MTGREIRSNTAKPTTSPPRKPTISAITVSDIVLPPWGPGGPHSWLHLQFEGERPLHRPRHRPTHRQRHPVADHLILASGGERRVIQEVGGKSLELSTSSDRTPRRLAGQPAV